MIAAGDDLHSGCCCGHVIIYAGSRGGGHMHDDEIRTDLTKRSFDSRNGQK